MNPNNENVNIAPSVNQNSNQDVNNGNGPVQQNTFKIKKKPNIVIIIVILAIVGFIAYFMLTKVNFVTTNPNSEDEEKKKIAVSTGENWGDKYALYVQSLFDMVDQFDITYIDFNRDNTPEAVVRYSTDTEENLTWILMINNDEVSETKVFYNASFKLLYSSVTDDVNWYIYIARSEKYGAYTLMSKILDGTALDSDIKATNDREIASFNASYVASSYDQSFYEVKEESFAEDFKTSVSKYSGYLDETNEAISKLLDDNKASLPTPEEDTNEYISIGEFMLHYGDYVTEVPKYENGEEVGVEERIISVNRDGTITDGDNIIKFEVYTGSISLETGISFKVTGNDTFVYGQGTGLEYKLKSSSGS